MWVANNMSYINPNTGLHPLTDILANGGGDCGNQATVFNTLMRCIDVPARHVVMVRTNGTFHVRSEFYLAGYGWIPVDANAKNEIPNGDFFGNIQTNEIVVNSNINIPVDLDHIGPTNLVLLQNFAAWYWWYNETPIEFYHTVFEI
jgi:transglutaminase-like putative cysteine protease